MQILSTKNHSIIIMQLTVAIVELKISDYIINDNNIAGMMQLQVKET